MPTYEYMCRSCGHIFEKFQGMNDAPLRECPECDGTVQRLISGGTGFIVKGESAFTGRTPGKTCCGRTERCEKPPCSDDSCCTK